MRDPLMRECRVRELGRVAYDRGLELQQQIAARRQQGLGPDHLLLLEHPHVITMGRNGHMENLLASHETLGSAGIAFYPTDRGGDVTYHGPGQLVGYPILDLREWQRDVGAYVRAVEQTIIDTLADYGIAAGRIPKLTGVWVGDRKIAAIGVHLSRWVTSHGFALNVSTDLSYFRYIVPCGLTRPVTSMAVLGVRAGWDDVGRRLAVHFGRIFDCEMRFDTPPHDAPPPDAPPHDTPPHDTPPHDAPPPDAPPHVAPPHDTPPHVTPPHDTPPHSAPPRTEPRPLGSGGPEPRPLGSGGPEPRPLGSGGPQIPVLAAPVFTALESEN